MSDEQRPPAEDAGSPPQPDPAVPPQPLPGPPLPGTTPRGKPLRKGALRKNGPAVLRNVAIIIAFFSALELVTPVKLSLRLVDGTVIPLRCGARITSAMGRGDSEPVAIKLEARGSVAAQRLEASAKALCTRRSGASLLRRTAVGLIAVIVLLFAWSRYRREWEDRYTIEFFAAHPLLGGFVWGIIMYGLILTISKSVPTAAVAGVFVWAVFAFAWREGGPSYRAWKKRLGDSPAE